MQEKIPAEVYEIINDKKILPVGTTRKLRHLYKDDGSPCSLYKSSALAITRKEEGWVWYCHRCGARGALKELPMTVDQIKEYVKEAGKKQPLTEGCVLPNDVVRIRQTDMSSDTRRVPWDAITWLLKYDVTAYLDKYFFGWSPSYHRIIMPIPYSSLLCKGDFKGPKLMGWVGRDPIERNKLDRQKYNIPKYLIRKGGPQRPIFAAQPQVRDVSKPHIIVEDIISAIKVSEAGKCPAYALLNTDVPRWLMESIGKSPSLLWLDENMNSKMIRVTAKYRSLGFNMRYVYTQKDPKCYNNIAIRKMIGYDFKRKEVI